MKILNVKQGSQEWLDIRAKHRTASDAPAMMGVSSHTSRKELLRQKATGDTPEVSPQLQRVFDKGHEVEAKARPIIEGRIGETLFPVTVVDDDGYLLASLDGLNMEGTTIWECKQWNAEKAGDVRNGIVPDCDYWQVVQQLLITGAQRCIYTVTDGTDEGTISTSVQLDPEDAAKLLGGWQQFDADLAEYQPRERKAEATGSAPGTLPALHIEVSGQVSASNVEEFREAAMAVIRGIKTDLQTDQDFADAEATVKWAKDVETRLQAAKDHALSQTEDLDRLFRTIDDIREETRNTRLNLEKSVKNRKEEVRYEIKKEAVDAIIAHYAKLNAGLPDGIDLATPPETGQTIADAMKGKKTVATLQDAADAALFDAKMKASATAERVRANAKRLDEIAADYPTLFPDRLQLVHKAPDDMEAAAKARIADHVKAEHERRENDERAQQAKERHESEEAQRREAGKCDGNHGGPPCADPECWNDEPHTTHSNPDPDAPATLKIGDITARLGLTLNGDFIESTLGIPAAEKKGRAVLYRERDFDAICDALIRHIAYVRDSERCEAA
ncbi:lambda-exonuclease family protein [Thioalkalivibrio sp. ARh3]|uniref:lambda-exonuclease family protein n=1 Tax=Thioalkalivibrio sp. ARh3 TaxID=1158148 RepID=UPI000377634F|nr:YqaJ viral recombinase family protein [Thioalkalivibrio sp. ARh3]